MQRGKGGVDGKKGVLRKGDKNQRAGGGGVEIGARGGAPQAAATSTLNPTSTTRPGQHAPQAWGQKSARDQLQAPVWAPRLQEAR